MPRRRCVGCGRIAPKSELLRSPPAAMTGRSRRAVIDPAGTLPGRGAYLCRAGARRDDAQPGVPAARRTPPRHRPRAALSRDTRSRARRIDQEGGAAGRRPASRAPRYFNHEQEARTRDRQGTGRREQGAARGAQGRRHRRQDGLILDRRVARAARPERGASSTNGSAARAPVPTTPRRSGSLGAARAGTPCTPAPAARQRLRHRRRKPRRDLDAPTAASGRGPAATRARRRRGERARPPRPAVLPPSGCARRATRARESAPPRARASRGAGAW